VHAVCSVWKSPVPAGVLVLVEPVLPCSMGLFGCVSKTSLAYSLSLGSPRQASKNVT
jgi:hypothetical protein